MQPYSDENEVIERANASRAGLAGSVFGTDIERCQRVGMKIETGSVFINSFAKPSPEAFFGGVKESGMGGEWGRQGLLAYCNTLVMHTFK